MKNKILIKSRIIKDVNGLDMHIRETGNYNKNNVILLLHGFPELSYSYRYLMLELTKYGFYCIAPDQRGYGMTKNLIQSKLSDYSVLNLTKDIFILLKKLNIKALHIIGHDFGAYISSYYSLLYPKQILTSVIMSMPFSGPPEKKNIHQLFKLNKALAKLKVKKKHYQYYFASLRASKNIMECSQGLKNFLRGYFHFKSYDFYLNKPFRLSSFSALEMAKLPEYYIMNYNLGMAQTVAKFMPSENEIKKCKWLNNQDLKVYVKSFEKNGIQKPLNWYKLMLSNKEKEQIIKLKLPDTTCIPTVFISGVSDWGVYQKPGEIEKMEKIFLKNYFGTILIDNAGHWVQQEQPIKTAKEILKFYNKLNIIN